MSSQNAKIELLAPAGSPACLKAACIAGADAVYLAGKRFGARAFAANFDEKSLRWARRVTEALGKKLYITLNTIVFEHEWKLLEEALDFYEILQPDALIIQDLGLAAELKRRKTRIPLHLSTQGAWFGQGGIEELKELGFTRVILPREVSAEEIVAIKKSAGIELEIFVHGAMCYSISGRCFWSIALGTRSGNRGTCAQPCRREYSVASGSGAPACLFSPRDLRLIDEMEWLLKAGITSLKIEGRMKSPEYVYQVVKTYREAIDKLHSPVKKENMLDEVFSRVSSGGFFYGPPDAKDWRTGETPGREGVIAGITTGRTLDGLVELRITEDLKPGDGVFWYVHGERQGARITWVKIDRKHENFAWVRGLPVSLASGIELRRTSRSDEGKWEALWNREWERRPVDLFWSGHEGMKLAVETVINGHPLHLESDDALTLAMNKGLEDGPLQEKFEVLGELFKSGRHVTTLLGKGLYISGSALKKLKRALVENICKLEQLPPPRKQPSLAGLIVSGRGNEKPDFSKHFSRNGKSEVRLRVWNHTFPFLRDLNTDCWVLPWNGDNSRADLVLRARIIYWLPPVLNSQHFDKLYSELKNLETGEFICFGWEAFALARLLPALNFTLDWSFNVCNLSSLDYVRSKGLDAVLAREWKEERIPENLSAFRSNSAWNPPVSFTRFQPDLPPGRVVQNSHNDRFFLLPIGNGVTAMFVEDKPASIVHHNNSSIQFDIAISPEENPVQVAKDLNRMLDSFRNG
ncbi:MAG: U32 family peptidase [Candidatus Riflebacteria bacterium]|nr:U32 family peptidase [Candidatus Riflebacteria bacterium]